MDFIPSIMTFQCRRCGNIVDDGAPHLGLCDKCLYDDVNDDKSNTAKSSPAERKQAARRAHALHKKYTQSERRKGRN